MEKNKGPLVIFGDQDFAQLAYEYFTVDSGYEVVGFAVDAAHRKTDALFGLPVVTYEEMEARFAPAPHCAPVSPRPPAAGRCCPTSRPTRPGVPTPWSSPCSSATAW